MDQGLDHDLGDEAVHPSRRGNQHSSQWSHFLIFPFGSSSPPRLFFFCLWFHYLISPASFLPSPICIYLYSSGGHCSRPTLSPTVHAFYCFGSHFLFSFLVSFLFFLHFCFPVLIPLVAVTSPKAQGLTWFAIWGYISLPHLFSLPLTASPTYSPHLFFCFHYPYSRMHPSTLLSI